MYTFMSEIYFQKTLAETFPGGEEEARGGEPVEGEGGGGEGEGEKRGDFVRELELPGAAWGAPRQDLETTGAYYVKVHQL